GRLGLAFSELEGRVLEFEDRLAERLAFFRIGGGQLHRALHRRHRADGDDQPLLRQLLHELDEALALLGAEQVLRRHDRVLEEQLRGVAGLQADLVEVAAAAEAVVAGGLQHQQRQALGAGAASARHDDHEIRGLAIGDE
ncbi:hypothetical protein QU38_01155, partial [Staphylococcus aureus]